MLRRPLSLLDVLDGCISVAAPEDDDALEHDGTLRVRRARLVRATAWDPFRAARFALDCAGHALGDAATVELPGGHLLGEVVESARDFVERADAPDGHLGLLARLATARRLRNEGRAVGDIALGLSMEDVAKDLDATLDPAWTTAAAVEDAVLAALEALRHVARHRYATLREDAASAQQADVTGRFEPLVWMTAWGPIVTGAEHESPYTPASIAAREAALRARETLRARSGEDAETAERAFQGARLAELLEE